MISFTSYSVGEYWIVIQLLLINVILKWRNKTNIGIIMVFEVSSGAVARGVTVKPTGCGFDPHSRRWNIYLNLYFHFFALVSKLSAALSSATQHAMPPEIGRMWGTECLNTRFPLPTLLCAGYSVKLIYLFIFLSKI